MIKDRSNQRITTKLDAVHTSTTLEGKFKKRRMKEKLREKFRLLKKFPRYLLPNLDEKMNVKDNKEIKPS